MSEKKADQQSWYPAWRAVRPLNVITVLFLAGVASVLAFMLAPSTGMMILAMMVDFVGVAFVAVFMLQLLDEHPEEERRARQAPAERPVAPAIDLPVRAASEPAERGRVAA